VNTPDPPPQRVRVTSPRTGVAGSRRVRSVRSEIDDQTQLGEVYMRSLIRTQLRLAFLVIGVLALTVGLLPVLFVLAPETRTTTVLGVPLPWLLLGLVVYPFLVLLGWVYVHRAERNEQSFSDLVERR
jgi:uncharacterized BrkB/YihY/UPF0761 family membrane protein